MRTILRNRVLNPRVALIVHIVLTLGIAITIAPESPYGADPSNHIRRAVSILDGTSPLAFPDPPLRLVSIASVIGILGIFGMSPEKAYLIFAMFAEFVAVPVAYYVLLQEWLNRDILVAVTLYLAALLMFVTYPWPNTALEMRFWMYAFPLPFGFLTLAFASRETTRAHLIAGVWLGIAANLQLFFGGLFALIVFLTYVDDIQRVIRVAATSMIVSIPLFGYLWLNYSYVLSYGGSKLLNGKPESLLSPIEILTVAIILLAFTGFSFLYYTNKLHAKSLLPSREIVVFGVVTVGTTLFFSVLDVQWMRVLLSYISKYAIYTALTAGVASWYISIRND